MNNSGYIKLWRKTAACPAIGNDWKTAGAWLAVLMKATHSETTYRGQQIHRGEFGFTWRELAAQWDKSPNTVRKALKQFEQHKMIQIRRQGECSILTVVNYERYQGVPKRDATPDASVSGSDIENLPEVSERDTIADTQNKKEKKKEKTFPTWQQKASTDSDFETWFKSYPKKVDKADATKVYCQVVDRLVDDADRPAITTSNDACRFLTAAALRYGESIRAAGTENKYVKAPATWLIKGAYDDEHDEKKPAAPAKRFFLDKYPETSRVY